MPLNVNGMEININGNADDYIASINKATGATDAFEKRIKAFDQQATAQANSYRALEAQKATALKEEADATDKATMSWTDFRSMYSTVMDGIRAGQEVWNQTVGVTMQYADEVRNLSLISGQSAESTSRFIQVLDDYGLTAQDAETATRALTKQGLAPSIDTLAKLSDQYLKINDSEEKNAFIMKNLGRAGLEWVGVLNQGSTAIKAQGANVEQSLILNQKQIDQSRELFLALDSIRDKWKGIQVELGSELIPTLTTTTNVINDNWESIKQWGGALEWVILPGSKIGEMLSQLVPLHIGDTQATKDYTDSTKANAAALQDNADALKADAEAAKKSAEAIVKAASQEREATLSAMFAIQGANKSYAAEEDKRAKDEIAIKAKEIQNAMEMQKVLQDIDHQKDILAHSEDKRAKTADERWSKQENISNNQQKLKDLQEKYMSLIADNLKQEEDMKASVKSGADALKDKEDATNKLVYAQLQQKAAQDGLVSPEEEKFLMDTAVEMGLVTRAEADMAIMATQTADDMWTAFTKEVAPLKTVVDYMDLASKHNGEVINVTVAYNVTGSPPSGTSSLPGRGSTNPSSVGPRAAGGSWVIPSAYGNEGYVMPDGNTASAGERVTVTPAGGQVRGGNVVNIYATVRNDNDLNYLTQEVTRRQTE